MRPFCILLHALPAFGRLTRDQKIFDFLALAGIYAKCYADLDWKRANYGFDATNIGLHPVTRQVMLMPEPQM